MVGHRTEFGAVQIRHEVIGNIAQLAAQEVAGVAGVWKGFFPLVSWRGISGVRVEMKDHDVRLWIRVSALYGVSIPSVASQVQDRVRDMVERMTSLTVAEVHVSVHSVQSKRS